MLLRFGSLLLLLLLSVCPAQAGDDTASVLARAKTASGGGLWDTVFSLIGRGEMKAAGLDGSVETREDVAGGRSVARYKLGLYQGASPDGECPLVVDGSTPSCGDSRFGCWVCTMVEQDKSMTAMIVNDEAKAWMLPLLDLRNELDVENDRSARDHRRMNGLVQLHKGRLVHGPYTAEARAHWLRRVLEVQKHVRTAGPEEMRHVTLITPEELDEIRRIWVQEKHEIEDVLPGLYENATGEPFRGRDLDTGFDPEVVVLLSEAFASDRARYELARDMLSIGFQHASRDQRSVLLTSIKLALRRHAHADPLVAMEVATRRASEQAASEAEEPGAQLAIAGAFPVGPLVTLALAGFRSCGESGSSPPSRGSVRRCATRCVDAFSPCSYRYRLSLPAAAKVRLVRSPWPIRSRTGAAPSTSAIRLRVSPNRRKRSKPGPAPPMAPIAASSISAPRMGSSDDARCATSPSTSTNTR